MAKDLRVGIVGSGVVGQATGRGFLAHGFPVTFIDTNLNTVQRLRHEGLSAYTPSERADQAPEFDVTILTVPTPTQNGEINLQYLEAAAVDLGRRFKHAAHYHVVVVRSTVVPGTTEKVVISTLEQYSGKKAGRDFGVCMNPEYLREKKSTEDFAHPWIVVIGQYDQRSGDTVAALYRDFQCPVYRLSLQEAETQKYVHNLFNAVKITFFNEFRQICEKARVSADAIFPLVAQSAEGMFNPEYGIRNFGPFDGMCLPKDTQAFLSWARAHGWDMPLLAQAIAVNNELVARQSRPAPAVRQAARDMVVAPSAAAF
ncbi:MAG: nucleotide sugar dehydrogenase [Candidatus Andersenbacteria bacterium]